MAAKKNNTSTNTSCNIQINHVGNITKLFHCSPNILSQHGLLELYQFYSFD